MSGIYLTTEDGEIITTESGQAILINQETSNADIQLFDLSVNVLQSLLWEYNDAKNLQGLLEAKSKWYMQNQAEFWNSWIQNVFDLRTANEFGLSVWSIILGLPLYVNEPAPSVPTFGFEGSGGVNFDNGILSPQNGSSVLLPITTQRIALQLRYTQLTCAGCVPEVNRALKWIFAAYGRCYLVDYGDMSQEYVFDFPLTWDLIYLFNNYDILPRPAGVSSGFIDATKIYFGFAPGEYNFDNGILA